MRISDWSSDVCSSDLADHRYHRDESIAQGVQADNAPGGEALGARRAHVVFAEHLQHGGARLACDDGKRDGSKRDGRQDEVAQRRLEGALQVGAERSEEHTSELQSLMRISYAVFCLTKITTSER